MTSVLYINHVDFVFYKYVGDFSIMQFFNNRRDQSIRHQPLIAAATIQESDSKLSDKSGKTTRIGKEKRITV